MSLITLMDSSVPFEICLRCYTGCDYCYKLGKANSRAGFVSFGQIQARLEWIKKFTDAKEISICGGEPLTHPDFIDICELVLSMGFKLLVITSGKVSNLPHEKNNRAYIVHLFETGAAKFILSYHGKRNHKEVVSIVDDFRNCFNNRRLNRVSMGDYKMAEFDLTITSILDCGLCWSPEELLSYINVIQDFVGFTRFEIDGEFFPELYGLYLEHSKGGEGKKALNWKQSHLNEYRDLRVEVYYRGATMFNKVADGYFIQRPEIGTCPATMCTVYSDSLEVYSILIRTDGGLSFPRAECIDMPFPLLNVDTDDTPEKIYSRLSSSIKNLMKMIYFYNRIKAQENCDVNGNEVECTACPYTDICNECWRMQR